MIPGYWLETLGAQELEPVWFYCPRFFSIWSQWNAATGSSLSLTCSFLPGLSVSSIQPRCWVHATKMLSSTGLRSSVSCRSNPAWVLAALSDVLRTGSFWGPAEPSLSEVGLRLTSCCVYKERDGNVFWGSRDHSSQAIQGFALCWVQRPACQFYKFRNMIFVLKVRL